MSEPFADRRALLPEADAIRSPWRARLGRLAVVAAVALLTVRTCVAWLPGLDPLSLWHDDLVWAAITRAPDLAVMVTVPAHAPPGFFVAL